MPLFRKEKNKKKAGKKIPASNLNWLDDFRYGRSVSLSFFKKNAWFLISVLVALIALMGLRYKTKTKMQEIKRLEKELVQAESAKLQEKAAYMTLIRESEMQRLVREKGLDLHFQEQPPFEITYDNN